MPGRTTEGGTLVGIADDGTRIFVSHCEDGSTDAWGWNPAEGRFEIESFEIKRGTDPELRSRGESPADRVTYLRSS